MSDIGPIDDDDDDDDLPPDPFFEAAMAAGLDDVTYWQAENLDYALRHLTTVYELLGTLAAVAGEDLDDRSTISVEMLTELDRITTVVRMVEECIFPGAPTPFEPDDAT